MAGTGPVHNPGTHDHTDHDHEDHESTGHSHEAAGHDHASHSDHDHDGHDHSHAPTVSAGNEKVVLIGFVLTATFMVAEVVAGVLSGSLALIADAGHMLTDAAALLPARAAFRFGRRASDSKRSFGYMRLEVVAGLVNALALFCADRLDFVRSDPALHDAA
ncbi:cation diffusion facilitator family transporter [Devosia sp. A8/3-2]|nr:cation diffusion facilitator family transporter [Devosia sp. A8/3-2]